MGKLLITDRRWLSGYLVNGDSGVIAFDNSRFIDAIKSAENNAAQEALDGIKIHNPRYEWYMTSSDLYKPPSGFDACRKDFGLIEDMLVKEITSNLDATHLNFKIMPRERWKLKDELHTLLVMSSLIFKDFDYDIQETIGEDEQRETCYALYEKEGGVLNRFFSGKKEKKLKGIFRLSEISRIEIENGKKALISVPGATHQVSLCR